MKTARGLDFGEKKYIKPLSSEVAQQWQEVRANDGLRK